MDGSFSFKMKNLKKKFTRTVIIEIIVFIGLILVDQFSKKLAESVLAERASISVIPGILEFEYLENKGAAFSIFQNQFWIFYVITILIFVIILYLYIKIKRKLILLISNDQNFTEMPKSICFLTVMLAIVAAGAIGNLIDRVFRGYVIDFIYLKFIHFPVFNLADIFITVSAVILIIFFLFFYKENENFKLFTENKK